MITASESDTVEKKHEVRKWLWRAKTNDSYSDITQRPLTRNGAMRTVREIELLPAFSAVMNNAPFTQASELHFTLVGTRHGAHVYLKRGAEGQVEVGEFCIRDPHASVTILSFDTSMHLGCFRGNTQTAKHTF